MKRYKSPSRCQGFVPDPAGGAYSALPDPLVGLRGRLLHHIRALAYKRFTDI